MMYLCFVAKHGLMKFLWCITVQNFFELQFDKSLFQSFQFQLLVFWPGEFKLKGRQFLNHDFSPHFFQTPCFCQISKQHCMYPSVKAIPELLNEKLFKIIHK